MTILIWRVLPLAEVSPSIRIMMFWAVSHRKPLKVRPRRLRPSSRYLTHATPSIVSGPIFSSLALRASCLIVSCSPGRSGRTA